jgi:hypothetical protein
MFRRASPHRALRLAIAREESTPLPAGNDLSHLCGPSAVGQMRRGLSARAWPDRPMWQYSSTCASGWSGAGERAGPRSEPGARSADPAPRSDATLIQVLQFRQRSGDERRRLAAANRGRGLGHTRALDVNCDGLPRNVDVSDVALRSWLAMRTQRRRRPGAECEHRGRAVAGQANQPRGVKEL